MAVEASKPRRRRLSTAGRRAELIEGGIRLFSSASYDELTTPEIAKQVGVSKGLLYHYFPSKKAFYAAVLEAMGDRMMAATRVESGLPIEQAIHAGIDAFTKYMDENVELYATVVHGDLASSPPIRAILQRVRSEMIDFILDAMGETDPSPELSFTIRGWVGFVEAAAFNWSEERSISRDELVALLAARSIALFSEGT